MGFVSNRKNKGFGEVTVNEKKVESLVKQIRRKMRENDEGEIAFFATKKTFRQELAKAVEKLYAMPAYRDYIFLSPVNKGEMLDVLSENSASITDVLNAPDNYIFMPIISMKAQENLLKEDPSFYEQITALSEEKDNWLN